LYQRKTKRIIISPVRTPLSCTGCLLFIVAKNKPSILDFPFQEKMSSYSTSYYSLCTNTNKTIKYSSGISIHCFSEREPPRFLSTFHQRHRTGSTLVRNRIIFLHLNFCIMPTEKNTLLSLLIATRERVSSVDREQTHPIDCLSSYFTDYFFLLDIEMNQIKYI